MGFRNCTLGVSHAFRKPFVTYGTNDASPCRHGLDGLRGTKIWHDLACHIGIMGTKFTPVVRDLLKSRRSLLRKHGQVLDMTNEMKPD